jgi:hypothetical protein
MADVPNSSSFIPKRTAGSAIRKRQSRNFFLLAILSYACLIAAPTASAAVYVYKLYTDRQFEELVTQLDQEIAKFSEADMARVLEFDSRQKAAAALVDNHISLVRAIEALEIATANNVAFSELNFRRLAADTLAVEGSLLATNFDTAIFQRAEYYKEAAPFASSRLENIVFEPAGDGGSERVSMEGTFTFTDETVAFVPDSVVVDTPTPVVDSSDDTPSESTENAVNSPTL